MSSGGRVVALYDGGWRRVEKQQEKRKEGAESNHAPSSLFSSTYLFVAAMKTFTSLIIAAAALSVDGVKVACVGDR